jgi:hypothetical protein
VRIRSIKPEFWKSERMAGLSRDARLLFIGLWNLADDWGRFRAHPSLIRGELFAYDDDADVAAWLQTLVDVGVVRLYTIAGQRYGQVANFQEHQKIDKRAASRIPAEPGSMSGFAPSNEGEKPDIEPAAEEPAQPAEQSAEPAEKVAEPADFTPMDQGAGSREGNRERNMAPSSRGRGKGGGAKPQPEGAKPKPPDTGESPVADLTSALMRTRYRAGIGNAIVRRANVRTEAERLVATGLDASHVAALAALASQKTSGDSGALLAHWLDGEAWREVLDEQQAKQRQVGDLKRAKEHQQGQDLLQGIYGEDAIPAASVIGQVLASARPA